MKYKVCLSKIVTLLCLFLFCITFDIYGEKEWDQLKGEVVGMYKNISGGVSNFIDGICQSFGSVPSDYKYSLQMWNDAPAPILVVIQDITSVMGTKFHGNIDKGASNIVTPGKDSGEVFYNIQLYISVWLCAEKGSKEIKKYAKSAQEGLRWGAGVGAVVGLGVASPITAALGAVLGGLIGGKEAVEETWKDFCSQDHNATIQRSTDNLNALNQEGLRQERRRQWETQMGIRH